MGFKNCFSPAHADFGIFTGSLTGYMLKAAGKSFSKLDFFSRKVTTLISRLDSEASKCLPGLVGTVEV